MIVETLNDARVNLRRVFFEGTGALAMGTGVCYNRDYGTATASDDSRDRRVEVPSQGNHLWFAGIVTQAYAANPAGQWITIAERDSVVPVLVDGTVSAIGQCGGFIANHASTNTDVGKFSATYNNGRGVGSVEFLQTRTGAGLAMARVLSGPQAGGVEAFTAAASLALSANGTSVITRAAGVASSGGAAATALTLADGAFVGQTKRVIFTAGTSNAVEVILSAASKGRRPGTGASAGEQLIDGTAWRRLTSGTSGTDRVTVVWDGEFWRVTATNVAAAGYSNAFA